MGDLDGDGVNDVVMFEGARSGLLADEDATNAGEALEPGEAALILDLAERMHVDGRRAIEVRCFGDLPRLAIRHRYQFFFCGGNVLRARIPMGAQR